MKLSRYTECALLILTYLAARPGRLVSIGEVARIQGISYHHLTKIVPNLRRAGFVDVCRGRDGGVRLARKARQVRLADVVRHTERSFSRIENRDQDDRTAPILSALHIATGAFLRSLEDYSLADLVALE
jgi:Rrf2 family nitric oxide-sensitive transcriptional repressor